MSYLYTEPQYRPLTDSGAIMPGATLTFYATGTTTPANTYADADLMTAHDNPVVADAAGRFAAIYLDPAVTYRALLHDADAVEIYDIDPYVPPRDYPAGTIVWFHGDATARDAAYPSALWQVCDGTNGSPDLMDRSPVGAGTTYASGDTAGGTSVTSGAAGGHDHGGATGSYTLLEADIPAHRHQLLGSTGSGEATPLAGASSAGISGHRNGGSYTYHDDPTTGGPLVEDTGGDGGHSHTISSESNHQHSVAITPPICALWALMRKS